jgi:predicted amidophosphoribosyltransferase
VPTRPTLADLDVAPGFGHCGRCVYQQSGYAALCFACARRTIEALAPADQRCATCDLPFAAGEDACRNPLCSSPDRQFDWNYAIAMRSGQLLRAIDLYKVHGRYGWALIFGRVLAGFLEQEAELFRGFDLIVASPTYVGAGGRAFDHTRRVLEHAAAEVLPGRQPWPFDLADPGAIVKTAPSRPFRGKTWQERRAIARDEIRPALSIHPGRTAGRSILVYDDVFTDGMTLNEVARALRTLGTARRVCGVTLCRQPWRG